jgi:hypothetical protein
MNKIVSFFILILVCSCSDRKEHIANILSMNSIDIKTNRINKDEVIARGAFPFEMIDSLFFLFNGDPSHWFYVNRMLPNWDTSCKKEMVLENVSLLDI